MCSGVGKSGSPAPKPMTGPPAALSAFALASTARVADSAMAAMRRETRCSEVTAPSWHAGPAEPGSNSASGGGPGLRRTGRNGAGESLPERPLQYPVDLMALCGRLGRRLLLLAIVLGALASTVAVRPVSAAPGTQEPSAYIVVDASTGNVLEGKNVHEPHLTASTVKVLTALVAMERLPLDSTVPVSARAESQPASKISMLAGQVWPLSDALHALLMESANDAAFAIAERASGSIEKFAV